MSLLAKLAPVASTSPSTSESMEVIVSSLSSSIEGKFGKFRQFTVDGNTYNIDDNKVSNASVFKPNSKATLTVREFVNKEGEVKVVCSALSIHFGEGCGLFVMR